MRSLYFIGLLSAGLLGSSAHAEMPRNVKCAIKAQQASRSMGFDYKKVYNRTFELCMLQTMPRKRQTEYLIEKLEPYVAISPGIKPATTTKPKPARKKSTDTWVKLSPHVWVLQREP